MTIEELQKQNPTQPLLLTRSEDLITAFPFTGYYFDNSQVIDSLFVKEHGFFDLAYDTDLNGFHMSVLGLIIANEQKFKRLWDLTGITYNPIENYSMVENGDDTVNGTDNETINTAERKRTNNIGAQKLTDVMGNQHEVSDLDAVTQDVVNTLSAYNVETFSNDTKQNSTTNPRQDVLSKDSYTDVHSQEAREDIETQQATEDTRSVKKTVTTSHSLKRSGNIGVTTSQQMAQSEIELWNSFSFFKVWFDDIVSRLLSFHDDWSDDYECDYVL